MNIIHRDLNSHNCLVREVSSLGREGTVGAPPIMLLDMRGGRGAGGVCHERGLHREWPTVATACTRLHQWLWARRRAAVLLKEALLWGHTPKWGAGGAGSPGSKGQ